MHKSYEAYLQLNLRILIYASLVRICMVFNIESTFGLKCDEKLSYR